MYLEFICLQLSIDIGTEVKYQNKMLDDMVSLTLEYSCLVV